MTLIIEPLKSVILLLVCKVIILCAQNHFLVLNIHVHSKSLVDLSLSYSLSIHCILLP